MPNVVEKHSYILVELGNNNNKYWNVELYDNGNVVTSWGRVGYSGQSKTFTGSGEGFMRSKIREKTAKGYQEAQTINGAATTKRPSSALNDTRLAAVATSQIKTNNVVAERLVKRLIDTNVHTIMAATGGNLKYDDTTGVFSTPLGVLTRTAIVDARQLLGEIAEYVDRSDFDNQELRRTVNRYLMIVPTYLGMGRHTPHDLYPNLTKIQEQNRLIDDLEASIAIIEARPKPTTDTTAQKQDEPRLFDVILELVEDGKKIDEIRRAYKSTWQSIHASATLDVKSVYRVEIGGMASAFTTDGAKLGNHMRLWHGTRVGNLLSMFKCGFIIPPAQSGHCTGRMFGNGLYFSDQSTKSLNYATGSAPGQRGGYEQFAFMFLNDVAMGNAFTPRSYSECSGWNKAKAGYDSVFAKGGYSGVMNNEMIVFRPSQVNPQYLVEFTTGGK